jgi:hypothetical protein
MTLYRRASAGMCLALCVLLLGHTAKANGVESETSEFSLHSRPGLLLAQNEGDDAYDPFADYSEFEETMDEEEDINFFRNGRLMTLGFIGGYRGWTGNMSATQAGSPGFGVFLSYFFDLRFALQFGYLTSDHTLIVKGKGSPIHGSISLSDLSFNLKYYFNTQNVTRGLADLNPFLLAGFSQIYRTTVVGGNENFGKDSAFGFNIGAGMEIPMMRNKMFFGFEGLYQLVNFPNEGIDYLDANDVDTGVAPTGDSFLVLGIIGINY